MSNVVNLEKYFEISLGHLRGYISYDSPIRAESKRDLSGNITPFNNLIDDRNIEPLDIQAIEHLEVMVHLVSEDHESYGYFQPPQIYHDVAAILQLEKVDISRVLDNQVVSVHPADVIRRQSPHYPPNYMGFIRITDLVNPLFWRMNLRDQSYGNYSEYERYRLDMNWFLDQLVDQIELFDVGMDYLEGYLYVKHTSRQFYGRAILKVRLS